MKILYIADPLIVGGATRSLVDVVTSIKARGMECVVCTSEENSLSKELHDYGIQNFSSGHRAVMDVRPKTRWMRPVIFILKAIYYYIRIPAAIHKIESMIDMETVDLIHTNSVRSDIGMLLSRKYHIPHVAHIREFGEEDFDCWTYRSKYTKFINRNTSKIIAISEAVKNSWIRKGIDAEKIKVIYNGVNNKTIIPISPIKLQKDRLLRLVAVGGICEPKGQLQIIEAIGLLPKEVIENITLDLVGWGDESYIELIRNRAKELKVTDQLTITGAVSGVGPILQNYHIGLLCSKSEGFGRVTAEYMHAGLGVIASDTGANPELIQDSETGLLYRYGDTLELAQKIEKFYKDRNLLSVCAFKGRKQAEERFTKDKNADSLFSLYQEIMEHACKPSYSEEYGRYEH